MVYAWWLGRRQPKHQNQYGERSQRRSRTDVKAVRLIALQDRNLHNVPPYAYNVCKAFVLCEVTGGSFQSNIETTESRYFSLDEIPALAEEKNNKEQIAMCFAAYLDENWKVPFD